MFDSKPLSITDIHSAHFQFASPSSSPSPAPWQVLALSERSKTEAFRLTSYLLGRSDSFQVPFVTHSRAHTHTHTPQHIAWPIYPRHIVRHFEQLSIVPRRHLSYAGFQCLERSNSDIFTVRTVSSVKLNQAIL